jgi:predicted HicB family RNase H-like nuclease
MNKNELLKRARELARAAKTWAEFSNSLFNPDDGIITQAYPSRSDREAFMKSDTYRRIRELLNETIERTGLVEGATPQKSGRFMVRVPRSLHAALEQEAAHEGVSLNQLVAYKLAAQIQQPVDS